MGSWTSGKNSYGFFIDATGNWNLVVSITLSSAIIFYLFFSATTSSGFCLLPASSLRGARSSEKGYKNFYCQYLGSRFISKCLDYCLLDSSFSISLSVELGGLLLSTFATILALLRLISSILSFAAFIWSLNSPLLSVFSSLNSHSFLSSSISLCFSLFAWAWRKRSR